MKENIKEWFSTAFGILPFCLLAAAYFFHWPRDFSITENVTVAIVAGVFVFGNPKSFFSKASSMLLNKFIKK